MSIPGAQGSPPEAHGSAMARDGLASAGLASAGLASAGLLGSAVALAVAPALMPAGYSWVSHTTSESAAQALQGAWLARLGFLVFGLSVLLLAAACRRRWGPRAVALHAAFGALMTAAAAFSHRPWIAGQPFDRTEDLLHSVAASAMGFAFAIGVAATWWWRVRSHDRWRVLDAVAVVASVAVPLGMSAWPQSDGMTQRIMFAVAYAWYLAEAGRLIVPSDGGRFGQPQPGRAS